GEPDVLFATLIPVQVAVQLRFPEKVVVPPVRVCTSAIRPAVFFVSAAATVTLPLPPLTVTALPAGSLVAPIVPPFMLIGFELPDVAMPAPVVPSISTVV